MLLVTHFHLDHCAAVPFLLAHTPFRGRVFMTHSTKAIYHMLLADFVRLNRGGGDDPLFTEADLAGARVMRLVPLCRNCTQAETPAPHSFPCSVDGAHRGG